MLLQPISDIQDKKTLELIAEMKEARPHVVVLKSSPILHFLQTFFLPDGKFCPIRKGEALVYSSFDQKVSALKGSELYELIKKLADRKNKHGQKPYNFENHVDQKLSVALCALLRDDCKTLQIKKRKKKLVFPPLYRY